MKKVLLSIMMAIAITQSLFSQENTKIWIDIQSIQHIGLSEWSNIGYVNDGLPSKSITEIRGIFNCSLVAPLLYGFIDMGVGVMPAPEMISFNLDRMPMPYNETQYYLRDILSEFGTNNTSAHFKFTAGLFFNFNTTKNLIIMPYFGTGGLTMSQRSCNVILKEQDSNMQYNTMYVWGYKNNYNNDDLVMLGYLTLRLNFKYKISQKSSLLFGLEYTYFYESLDFYGKYYNTFNANIQRNFIIKGNKMNMLGISAGISFR